MTLVIQTRPVPLRTNKDGAIFVGTSRVPLDTVVYAFRNGSTAEEIVERYDVLKLSDVYAVIAYYLDHLNEVDAYIKQREEEASTVRQEMEDRFPPHGLRERLLARRMKNAQTGH
jgi:uncharacterized protein (DUF433 family)